MWSFEKLIGMYSWLIKALLGLHTWILKGGTGIIGHSRIKVNVEINFKIIFVELSEVNKFRTSLK